MLSNLVGLCELARATGDRQLLEPVLIAWEDIVANRLYLTGSASQGEHFRDDHDLPNQPDAHVAETCVTTTWIQLNSQLLRLTGEARFGDELEKTCYNHLAAAQRPDGEQWCYFTAAGRHEARTARASTAACPAARAAWRWCRSTPAWSRAATTASRIRCWSTCSDRGRPRVQLAGNRSTVKQADRFPAHRPGDADASAVPAGQLRFAGPRAPAWAQPMTLKINGEPVDRRAPSTAGWLMPPRDVEERRPG